MVLWKRSIGEKGTYKDGIFFDEPENNKQRRELNNRLKQIDKQIAPTHLRQAVKRVEVAKFRAKFPNKNAGRQRP